MYSASANRLLIGSAFYLALASGSFAQTGPQDDSKPDYRFYVAVYSNAVDSNVPRDIDDAIVTADMVSPGTGGSSGCTNCGGSTAGTGTLEGGGGWTVTAARTLVEPDPRIGIQVRLLFGSTILGTNHLNPGGGGSFDIVSKVNSFAIYPSLWLMGVFHIEAGPVMHTVSVTRGTGSDLVGPIKRAGWIYGGGLTVSPFHKNPVLRNLIFDLSAHQHRAPTATLPPIRWSGGTAWDGSSGAIFSTRPIELDFDHGVVRFGVGIRF